MASDEALFERWSRGDLDAFDKLYERYETRLFAFIQSYLRDAQEAEDALHDAFVALVRNFKEEPPLHFQSWLFQIARNICLNRLRSRNRAEHATSALSTATASEATSLSTPELEALTRERFSAMQIALSQLPTELAELFQLRSSGLSYEEMATVIGVPLGTVKSRMHQLIHRLRAEVQ
jgi:RNA polymerase sigma-70 factor, ECF subfamily